MFFRNTRGQEDAERALAARSGGVAVMEKSKAPKIRSHKESNLMSAEVIAEYRKTCEQIGLDPADIIVEEFRTFLAANDLPTFKLTEVCKYMDDLTARDNPSGLGWHWCPVRPKDGEEKLTFGRPSVIERQEIRTDGGYSYKEKSRTPSSDFYESHRFQKMRAHQHPPSPEHWAHWQSPAYTRIMPLHALKKIAFIESNFTASKVIFLVTDYTFASHRTATEVVDLRTNPDPFLMAVIPNNAVAAGKGRFIIDVWDEPGFGIDKMLK